MSLFDNSIIDAYKKTKTSLSDSFLMENADALIGGDIDHLIHEAIDREQSETVMIFNEELLQREKDDADRMARRGYGGRSGYLESFLADHPVAQSAFNSSTEKNRRVRIPVEIKNTTKPHPDVLAHLHAHGWTTDDEQYHSGMASKQITVGNPEKGIPYQQKTVTKSIGSIMKDTTAHPHIRKAFENDPTRTGSSSSKYDIILSNHPHDVYGMSTGRGWTSCAQMRKKNLETGETNKGYDGPASRKMESEIENHTHVAYLVPRGGDVDTQAIARLTFKKHSAVGDRHQTLIPESTIYGSAPSGAKQIIKHEVGKLFMTKPGLVYKKHPDVYDDSNQPLHFPEGGVSKENIDAIWSTSKTKAEAPIRETLIKNIKPGVAYKSTVLKNLSKSLGDMNAASDRKDFVGAAKHAYDIDRTLPDKVNPHFDSDTEFHASMHKAIDSFDKKNPDHIEKIRVFNKNNFLMDGIHGDLLRRTAYRYAGATVKTPSELIDHIRYLHTSGSRPQYNQVNVADDHKFGANAIKTIGESLGKEGMLNYDNFKTAYHALYSRSGTKTGGNLYDHVVGLVKKDVHGADNLLDETVKNITTRGQNLASLFHHSKPETRKIIADKMGIDHIKLMREHKSFLKDMDDKINAMKEKN